MNRRKEGYALISMIAISATTLVFLMALAGIVQQASRGISQNKWDSELRNAAEIGVDYAIGQYNTSTTYPCALDLQSQTSLPTSYLANMSPGITVTITTKQITAPSDWSQFKQVSAVYAKQLDPTNNSTMTYLQPLSTNISIGTYRIIESQAARNGLSRTIRSFIQARFDAPPSGTPPAGPATSTQSYFTNPMFSNGPMTLAPASETLLVQAQSNPINTSGPQSSYNLTLNTNVSATIGSGTTVAGNVNITSALSGSSSTATIVSPGGVVNGTLITNGTFNTPGNGSNPVITTTAPTPGKSDNVLANADIASNTSLTRLGTNATAPAVQNPINQQIPQYQMAPAQGTSTSAQAFPEATSPNWTIPAGDYTTTDFATSNFRVEATFNGSSGSPVRLFVQDGTSPTAVQIDSSMMVNASSDARNLQIWYSGSEPININLKSAPFSGLIYAPNATVTITGKGNFFGGIVANSIQALNSGTINIYTDLNNTSKGNPNAPAKLTYQSNSTTGSQIQGWQSISWQELKP